MVVVTGGEWRVAREAAEDGEDGPLPFVGSPFFARFNAPF